MQQKKQFIKNNQHLLMKMDQEPQMKHLAGNYSHDTKRKWIDVKRSIFSRRVSSRYFLASTVIKSERYKWASSHDAKKNWCQKQVTFWQTVMISEFTLWQAVIMSKENSSRQATSSATWPWCQMKWYDVKSCSFQERSIRMPKFTSLQGVMMSKRDAN